MSFLFLLVQYRQSKSGYSLKYKTRNITVSHHEGNLVNNFAPFWIIWHEVAIYSRSGYSTRDCNYMTYEYNIALVTACSNTVHVDWHVHRSEDLSQCASMGMYTCFQTNWAKTYNVSSRYSLTVATSLKVVINSEGTLKKHWNDYEEVRTACRLFALL